jgi:histidinol dehydrogenase
VFSSKSSADTHVHFCQVIGASRVIPTQKAARYTGGLWVGKYLRIITYQEVASESARGHLGRLCGRTAHAETYEGHDRSRDLRISKFLGDEFVDEFVWIGGKRSASRLWSIEITEPRT